jgi:chemotaxis family two-component system response regulator Rcp1
VKGTTREILLAEDNPADVYLIREALREHNVEYTMRVASDGSEVLRILSPEHAHLEAQSLGLIILDLNLPRHDGIEILEHLRETTALAHIPVVVLTSSDSPRDRLIANQLGASCYLRKPSGLEQFLSLGATFKQLLEQTKSNAAEP